MRRVAVDLDELAWAMESHNSEYYFDPETGHVVFPDVSPEITEDVKERLISVDTIASAEGWRWMEEFALSVEEDAAREQILRAIHGRGAFSRFKDALHDHPALREQWFKFHDARMREEVLAWLADLDIEPVEAKEPSQVA